MPSDPEVIFLWRKHCGYCRKLREGLVAAGISLRERNIWEDADSAATVRKVARGNETVPTVIVGGRALVNPSVEQVIAAIHREFPGQFPQLPDGLPRRRWWRRWIGDS